MRPASNATVGIELADKKQAVVVRDHKSQVLARKAVKMSARQQSIRLNPRMSIPTAIRFALTT